MKKTYEELGLVAVRVAHYFRPDHVNVYRVAFDELLRDPDNFVRILSYDLLPDEIKVKLTWLNANDTVAIRPIEDFEDIGHMWASDDYHKEYTIYVRPDTVNELRGMPNNFRMQVEED